MPDQTVIEPSTQPPMGDGATTAPSQAPAPLPQGTAQQQTGSAVLPQVDNGDGAQQAEPGARPSDFGRTRREINNLKSTITDLVRRSQQQDAYIQQILSAPGQQQQKKELSNNDFYANPMGTLQAILEEKLNGFRSEIPKTLDEISQRHSAVANEQEALRMIEDNEFVKNDPGGIEKMQAIFAENNQALNTMSIVFPREAAMIALKIYNLISRGQTNRPGPGAPTRSQMMNTATSVQSGTPTPSLEDEAKALSVQVMEDPSLLQDPVIQEKVRSLKERRIKEQRFLG